VCAFSNWPILRAVKDMSAKTTADTFFKEVIAAHGVPAAIMTDSGSAFSSAFFTHFSDLLHIKHRMSASQAARSNGLAESVDKRVSELAKIYVDDDTDIESRDKVPEVYHHHHHHHHYHHHHHGVYGGKDLCIR